MAENHFATVSIRGIEKWLLLIQVLRVAKFHTITLSLSISSIFLISFGKLKTLLEDFLAGVIFILSSLSGLVTFSPDFVKNVILIRHSPKILTFRLYVFDPLSIKSGGYICV